ncbi:MAG: type II toxin-antitoxin system RelE/ParE family toxin [Candidatus Coatesbacteria bacterium]
MEAEIYRLRFYETRRGTSPARDFLDSLAERVRAKAAVWLGLLQERGPDLRRPYADVVEGAIRELRVSHGRIEVRLLYFVDGKDIVLTHGFVKKTRRVPAGEVEKALRCLDAWIAGKGGALP